MVLRCPLAHTDAGSAEQRDRAPSKPDKFLIFSVQKEGRNPLFVTPREKGKTPIEPAPQMEPAVKLQGYRIE